MTFICLLFFVHSLRTQVSFFFFPISSDPFQHCCCVRVCLFSFLKSSKRTSMWQISIYKLFRQESIMSKSRWEAAAAPASAEYGVEKKPKTSRKIKWSIEKWFDGCLQCSVYSQSIKYTSIKYCWMLRKKIFIINFELINAFIPFGYASICVFDFKFCSIDKLSLINLNIHLRNSYKTQIHWLVIKGKVFFFEHSNTHRHKGRKKEACAQWRLRKIFVEDSPKNNNGNNKNRQAKYSTTMPCNIPTSN